MTVDEDWKNNKHHWEEMGCLFFGLTHNAGALILYNTVIVYSSFIAVYTFEIDIIYLFDHMNHRSACLVLITQIRFNTFG